MGVGIDVAQGERQPQLLKKKACLGISKLLFYRLSSIKGIQHKLIFA